ncbi:MAG: hypothetical protein LQ340_007816 [Diploschistes diacapsis]|nr:MAG: hypothetical protein LQ340_007816 [Diploschistes diacapsis]
MALQPYPTGSAAESRKRKNVLTGYAEEIAVSDITFKTGHRKHLARQSKSDDVPRKKRQKGDASIVSGPGAYTGPWGKFEGEDDQYSEESASLASDEEYEEENSLIPTHPAAPMPQASTAYASDDINTESTEFHGAEQFDYQGRTYMHVPQDLSIDLRGERPESAKNYIPSKLIHTWRSHTKAITSLNFFPSSG